MRANTTNTRRAGVQVLLQSTAACLAAWLLSACASVQQTDLTFIVAGKTSNYRQSHDDQLQVLNYHFFAEIFTRPGGKVQQASLATPLSGGRAEAFTDAGYALELHGGRYLTEAELEAAYPDGAYHFSYTTPSTGPVTQQVQLGNPAGAGSGLPAAPLIRLSQAGSAVAPRQVDPDQDLRVQWSDFSAGGSDPLGIMDDLIFVIMGDCDGVRRAHSGRPFENTPYLTFADQSFVITAERLQADNVYQLAVEHAVLDTSIAHQVPAFATFATTSFLDIQTTGAAPPGQSCRHIRRRFDAGQTDRE